MSDPHTDGPGDAPDARPASTGKRRREPEATKWELHVRAELGKKRSTLALAALQLVAAGSSVTHAAETLRYDERYVKRVLAATRDVLGADTNIAAHSQLTATQQPRSTVDTIPHAMYVRRVKRLRNASRGRSGVASTA
jgi:hypothetical protein